MSITVVVKPQGVKGHAEFILTAELAWTVATLKEQVAGKLGLSGVRLVSYGKILKDDEATLAACGVKDGGSMFAVPDRSAQKPEEDPATLKTKYAQQLEELRGMGFEDEAKALTALAKHGGDLDRAVTALAEVNEAAAPTTSTLEVVANVYDISGGMAQMCSQMMIGKHMELLPHTGIVVFGQEFFCSQSPAVSEPGRSLPSPVKKTYALGRTRKTKEELLAFVETLKSEYTPATYDFIKKNSNHYADAVAKFLLDGEGLPDVLMSLAQDLGATPQGQQMAQMLSGMQAQNRNMFTPTGTFFHGGTAADPAMQQMFAGLAGAQPGAAQPQADPKARFKAELEELESMGFADPDACVRALLQCNGNISLAVDILAGA